MSENYIEIKTKYIDLDNSCKIEFDVKNNLKDDFDFIQEKICISVLKKVIEDLHVKDYINLLDVTTLYFYISNEEDPKIKKMKYKEKELFVKYGGEGELMYYWSQPFSKHSTNILIYNFESSYNDLSLKNLINSNILNINTLNFSIKSSKTFSV